MTDVLQANQFRVARGETYEKKHHNGQSDSDDDKSGEVREIDAHKNVFHRQ